MKDHLITLGIMLAAGAVLTVFIILIIVTHGQVLGVIILLAIPIGLYFIVLDRVRGARQRKELWKQRRRS